MPSIIAYDIYEIYRVKTYFLSQVEVLDELAMRRPEDYWLIRPESQFNLRNECIL